MRQQIGDQTPLPVVGTPYQCQDVMAGVHQHLVEEFPRGARVLDILNEFPDLADSFLHFSMFFDRRLARQFEGVIDAIAIVVDVQFHIVFFSPDPVR